MKNRSLSNTLETDPQALCGNVLRENAPQCMENSVTNVKQSIIYNTGCELYVILQLISCCCWMNFINLNLQNEPSKDTNTNFKPTAKPEFFFLKTFWIGLYFNLFYNSNSLS